MIKQILGKSKTHSLMLFAPEEVAWLEGRIFSRKRKTGTEWAVNCFVRGKDVKLTPEEVVRQLYAHRLEEAFGYPVSRLMFEYSIFFGREAKRADIVVRDKDDPNVPYIIVETKKPNVSTERNGNATSPNRHERLMHNGVHGRDRPSQANSICGEGRQKNVFKSWR